MKLMQIVEVNNILRQARSSLTGVCLRGAGCAGLVGSDCVEGQQSPAQGTFRLAGAEAAGGRSHRSTDDAGSIGWSPTLCSTFHTPAAGPGEGAAHRQHDGELGLPADTGAQRSAVQCHVQAVHAVHAGLVGWWGGVSSRHHVVTFGPVTPHPHNPPPIRPPPVPCSAPCTSTPTCRAWPPCTRCRASRCGERPAVHSTPLTAPVQRWCPSPWRACCRRAALNRHGGCGGCPRLRAEAVGSPAPAWPPVPPCPSLPRLPAAAALCSASRASRAASVAT